MPVCLIYTLIRSDQHIYVPRYMSKTHDKARVIVIDGHGFDDGLTVSPPGGARRSSAYL